MYLTGTDGFTTRSAEVDTKHTHTPTNHTYTGNTGLPLVNVQACTHFFILLIKPDIVEAFSHSSVGETPRLTGGS